MLERYWILWEQKRLAYCGKPLWSQPVHNLDTYVFQRYANQAHSKLWHLTLIFFCFGLFLFLNFWVKECTQNFESLQLPPRILKQHLNSSKEYMLQYQFSKLFCASCFQELNRQASPSSLRGNRPQSWADYYFFMAESSSPCSYSCLLMSMKVNKISLSKFVWKDSLIKESSGSYRMVTRCNRWKS